jgi:hypothetical protein
MQSFWPLPPPRLPAGLPTGDFGWGSKTFGKMGRKKIRLIATFLQLGVQVGGWVGVEEWGGSMQ